MLRLEGIDAFYGASHALHSLSMTIEAGAITTILGRNGVGKTTLLRTIMGLMQRVVGTVWLERADITTTPAYRRARAGLAYVPQGRGIVPGFTIRENILMGTFARADRRRIIPELVGTLFPYLMQNLDRLGGVLSGGQQQQLAMARALAAGPRILLLDEPTEGIQPSIVFEIQELILRLNREGLTVALVEQNIAFARRAGHRFVMMEKGRVVAGGLMTDLTDALVHRHMAL